MSIMKALFYLNCLFAVLNFACFFFSGGSFFNLFVACFNTGAAYLVREYA